MTRGPTVSCASHPRSIGKGIGSIQLRALGQSRWGHGGPVYCAGQKVRPNAPGGFIRSSSDELSMGRREPHSNSGLPGVCVRSSSNDRSMGPKETRSTSGPALSNLPGPCICQPSGTRSIGQEASHAVSIPSRGCRDEPRCPAGAVVGYGSPGASRDNDDPAEGAGDTMGKRGTSLEITAEANTESRRLAGLACGVPSTRTTEGGGPGSAACRRS